MKFTFGIVTENTVSDEVLQSIIQQNVSEYEIIIIGGYKDWYKFPNIRHFEFDETIKPAWLTKKKNLITENAKYDNIVYLHDYFIFEDGWYDGFKKFGNDWDICMNVIKNADGTRFRDWCAWNDPEINFPVGGEINVNNPNHRIMLPSYSYNKTRYMYISGSYWISKKYVMQEEPLNEDLVWKAWIYHPGTADDTEWSDRVLRNGKYKYKMNEFSSIKSKKQKKLSAEYLD